MQASLSLRLIRYLIMACSSAGGVVSAVSLHNHYAPSATEFCDLSATFNCDFVNRSVYSEVLGIPVALFGVLGYLLLLGLSLCNNRRTILIRFGASIVGLGFALYLTYIEAYVLMVWCLLCIGSLTMILVVSVLSAMVLWRNSNVAPRMKAV